MRRASGNVRSPFVANYDCLTFLTDYGVEDGFVAACHGVAARISPSIRLIDVTHLVPPGDVRRGAAVLAQTIPYLPPAVHVAVVDPGVGTARRGFVWTEVTVTGVAAHGSRPHLGADAIELRQAVQPHHRSGADQVERRARSLTGKRHGALRRAAGENHI